MRKSAVYYTENRLDEKIAKTCRKQLRNSFDGEIVCVSLKPINFGDVRIVLDKEPGYLTMYEQILAGLEAATGEVIYMAEHDVLYPKEHFEFTPKDQNTFYYNQNWWKVDGNGRAVHWDADQVSGMCAYKDILVDFYRNRVETFNPETFDRKFEPMSGNGSVAWKSSVPLVDIRHNRNLTYSKWSLEDFRNKDTAVNFEVSTVDKIPGWQGISAIIKA